MANDAKRTSQLTVTTSLANTDRLVVLTNPASSAQTQTITVNNFIYNTINNFPIANTTQRGVVRSGNVVIAAANGVLSVNSLNFAATIVTGNLTVNGGVFFTGNVTTSNTIAPVTSTSNGTTGQIALDTNYIYICVSSNVWKRVALNLTSW